MKIAPYGGWNQCALLARGGLKVWVSLEVGPRILHLSLGDGPNLLAALAAHRGLVGGKDWRLYGGHRLWIAPEDPVLTYQADNDPVEFDGGEGVLTVKQQPEALTGLRKEIRIELVEGEQGVLLTHRIENRSEEARRLAPWALTCMAPGGRCVIPNEPALAHEDALLPARSMALWSYTDLGDPRFRFGPGFLELRQDPAAKSPQKVGLTNRQGWAAYVLGSHAFVKRFPFIEGRAYPDLGCNCEFFTNEFMLEVESLGPLVDLLPGERVEHVERWDIRSIDERMDDEALARLPESLDLPAV